MLCAVCRGWQNSLLHLPACGTAPALRSDLSEEQSRGKDPFSFKLRILRCGMRTLKGDFCIAFLKGSETL